MYEILWTLALIDVKTVKKNSKNVAVGDALSLNL